jgi:hypothetical protein
VNSRRRSARPGTGLADRSPTFHVDQPWRLSRLLRSVDCLVSHLAKHDRPAVVSARAGAQLNADQYLFRAEPWVENRGEAVVAERDMVSADTEYNKPVEIRGAESTPHTRANNFVVIVTL